MEMSRDNAQKRKESPDMEKKSRENDQKRCVCKQWNAAENYSL